MRLRSSPLIADKSMLHFHFILFFNSNKKFCATCKHDKVVNVKKLFIFRFSNLMCASLCTADEMCNAYRFNNVSGCILGNATQLVGVNARSKETTQVHINAALVPGMFSVLIKHCIVPQVSWICFLEDALFYKICHKVWHIGINIFQYASVAQ